MTDRDALIATIYRTHAAPYGDHITPALAQQLRICASLAADELLATMAAERVAAERARREQVRELAKLPLRQRLAQRKAVTDAGETIDLMEGQEGPCEHEKVRWAGDMQRIVCDWCGVDVAMPLERREKGARQSSREWRDNAIRFGEAM